MGRPVPREGWRLRCRGCRERTDARNEICSEKATRTNPQTYMNANISDRGKNRNGDVRLESASDMQKMIDCFSPYYIHHTPQAKTNT